MNDSIFPFIDTSLYQEKMDNEELEELCEYAFDYKNNCLLKNEAGQNYYVYRNEALKIWIYKALMTSRYRHLAYSDDFGNEMFELIGKAIDHEVLLLELKRYVTEALMYNQYIRELSEFDFIIDGSNVVVKFKVTSVYGDMVINHKLGGDT